MPGFGSGPFGGNAGKGFGEWKWSRQVLYDFLPEIYKREDQENFDGLLEKFSEGERPSFDNLRFKIREYDALRDPNRVRTQYDEVEVLRLGRGVPDRGEVEQKNIDGVVEVATQRFTSPSARFSPEDIGKQLVIFNSSIESNNLPVRVAAIISTTTITTNPTLQTDAGPLKWELRAFTSETDFATVEVQSGDVSRVTPGWQLRDGVDIIEIVARQQLGTSDVEKRLFTEKEGRTAFVDSLGRIVAPTANFTQRDVGKKFTLAQSSIPENNGKSEIFRVVDSTTVLPSFALIRGVTSSGGVGYSALGADLGNITPRIRHEVKGLSTPLSVSVDGADVTVTLATNGFGEPVSTGPEVEAAVNADAEASIIFRATAEGTGVANGSGFIPVPGRLLDPDSGPLDWALLPRPQLRLKGRVLPRGLVEREGTDLEVVTDIEPSTVRSEQAIFGPRDIGKKLLIRGSAVGNDGAFNIVDVIDVSTAKVDALLTVESGPLFWEVRTPTPLEDTTQVTVNAPAIINSLARDFGIEIDNQESEARQRACVRHVTRWIGKKGNFDSYRILGLLSGFDVDVSQLFRVNQDIFQAIPDLNKVQVAKATEGKFGADGSLVVGEPGRIVLSSPTAQFDLTDLEDQILVDGAGTSSNNKFYTIDKIVSPTSVQFRFADEALVPDPNNGSLTWSVVRLYTDLPPLLPDHDDFNSDALEEYIDTKFGTSPRRFSVDKFCWEEDWTTEMDTSIVDVEALSPTNYVVEVALSPFPLADIALIIPDPGTGIKPAVWKLTDSSGTEFFMETFPQQSGGTATFEVFATQPPVTGAATLEYICELKDFDCGYCSASVAKAKIQAGSILAETGDAVQQALERVLDRLETEAKPAHVQLIPEFQQTLEANVVMTASGYMDIVLVDPVVLDGDAFVSGAPDVFLTGGALLEGEAEVTSGETMIFAESATLAGSATVTGSPVIMP